MGSSLQDFAGDQVAAWAKSGDETRPSTDQFDVGDDSVVGGFLQ